jgi:hypothetical protein
MPAFGRILEVSQQGQSEIALDRSCGCTISRYGTRILRIFLRPDPMQLPFPPFPANIRPPPANTALLPVHRGWNPSSAFLACVYKPTFGLPLCFGVLRVARHPKQRLHKGHYSFSSNCRDSQYSTRSKSMLQYKGYPLHILPACSSSLRCRMYRLTRKGVVFRKLNTSQTTYCTYGEKRLIERRQKRMYSPWQGRTAGLQLGKSALVKSVRAAEDSCCNPALQGWVLSWSKSI